MHGAILRRTQEQIQNHIVKYSRAMNSKHHSEPGRLSHTVLLAHPVKFKIRQSYFQ